MQEYYEKRVELLNLLEQIEDAENRGSIKEATELMRDALELSEEICGEESPEVVDLLSELGGLLRYTGEYDDSRKALTRALELIEKNQGRVNLNYPTALLNLAGLHRYCGEFKEAEKLMLETKKIYTELDQPPGYRTAGICNNLALLYQDMGEFEKAIPLHKTSLQLMEGHPEWILEYAITLNNLWMPYLRVGRAEEAEQCLLQALDIIKREAGEKHALYTAGLNNYATWLFQQKRYEESKELFEQSLALCEKTMGRESDNYKKLCRHLEMVQQKLDEEKDPSLKEHHDHCHCHHHHHHEGT